MSDREQIIKAAVDKFLVWQFPEDFNPDGAISFTKYWPNQTAQNRPVGTNLLTADQAKAMFEYCLAEAWQAAQATPPADMVSVPREPTVEMLVAGALEVRKPFELSNTFAGRVYRAMIGSAK